MENTTTHNGDSKRISLEEAKILESKTDTCTLQVVNPEMVNTLPEDKKIDVRVTQLAVKGAREVEEEKPGDSLRTINAARIGERPEIIVKDGEKIADKNNRESGNDR